MSNLNNNQFQMHLLPEPGLLPELQLQLQCHLQRFQSNLQKPALRLEQDFLHQRPPPTLCPDQAPLRLHQAFYLWHHTQNKILLEYRHSPDPTVNVLHNRYSSKLISNATTANAASSENYNPKGFWRLLRLCPHVNY